ncbi:Ig-like domain-containing protein [Konateibacter massiliensis]|uniref:Ig-like domain-containing protein n=1 Tax=Konateibacter massiliensis TaxID=2002841 RepID=UPI000C1508AC|nr:Ig-like domain-containing protein [Konateibacter massiliensis]
MFKFSFKKMATAVALSMSLALTVPAILPAVSTVTTVEAAAKPTLSITSKSVRAGETFKLTVKNKGGKKVTWSTSNKKAATVKNGLVTATGKGKATITAKVGSKKLKCVVKVSSNSYSFDVKSVSEFIGYGFYVIPTQVYYKNGKLICKSQFINHKYYSKVKKVTDTKGKMSKINVTLTGTILGKTLGAPDTDVVLAKGKVANTYPKNISYGTTGKSFTIEFSASQIKKKGYDLSQFDLIDIDLPTFRVYF